MGARYDSDIDVFGVDLYVFMGRLRARVGRRESKNARVGFRHNAKEVTMTWFK